MLLVETYVSYVSKKGLGLLAKVRIAKGTTYWLRNESFDRTFSEKQLESFDKLASDYVRHYGFQERNSDWYLCSDNARFTNHSKQPNTKNHFDIHGTLQSCTVVTDVEVGEELLCDYSELCLTCINGVHFGEMN